jgi:hypothetical protein
MTRWSTPDGRTLAVVEVGAPDGPALVADHRTPSAGRLYRSEVESAERRGLRLIAYDLPVWALLVAIGLGARRVAAVVRPRSGVGS